MNLSKNDTMSLPEDLQGQIKRCEELMDAYRSIGPQGAFGLLMIGESVRKAKMALVENDAAAMVVALRDLRECE